MGTRGFVGFVAGGQEKIAYNHFDSYPEGLGLHVLGWLRGADLEQARKSAVKLRVIREGDDGPSDEDIERLKRFANLHVGERSGRPDWYKLLRETQGEPALILEAGVLEDASSFPIDPLFAEWGYVVDFDSSFLEVYKGFQTAPHDKGRFASRERPTGGTTYYPVALVMSWPLADLPDEEAFAKQFASGEDDE